MHFVFFRGTILSLLTFLQIKDGGRTFRGNQFCRIGELFGPSLCISVLNILWTQILRHSLKFHAFCMIQKYFSQNFWREPILQLCSLQKLCRTTELFCPPLCISISKVLRTQILRLGHLLDFNVFYRIKEYLSQSFDISTY